jgi:hypothetical protein
MSSGLLSWGPDGVSRISRGSCWIAGAAEAQLDHGEFHTTWDGVWQFLNDAIGA